MVRDLLCAFLFVRFVLLCFFSLLLAKLVFLFFVFGLCLCLVVLVVFLLLSP